MGRRKKKIGLPPGTIVFTGERMMDESLIHHIRFDTEKIEENSQVKIIASGTANEVNWYDVRGVHDTQLIQSIGQTFDIHPLILEDIVDTNQRAKFEEYEKGVFLVCKFLHFNKKELKTTPEQVSFYFNKNTIISFQETETDLFSAIRQRLLAGKGKVRSRGTDYLCYALLDVIIDHYYSILEEFNEEIENLEETFIRNPENHYKKTIHQMKREILFIRKNIAPLRETISKFSSSESAFKEDKTDIFLRNLYDHIFQVLDMVESLRDILTGLQEWFLSEVSFKMNQVMQVLTIVSAIFIPLTFLAGIYGMNFEYIPELHYRNGYFVLLGVMLVIACVLFYFFRRNKWL